jgi:signal transduction histidine kinase
MLKKNLILKNKRILQILILVTTSFVIMWLIISTIFYNFSYNRYEQSTLMRLAGIANSLSLQINGDQHQKLMENHHENNPITALKQDSIYDNIQGILKSNFEANMLKSAIYTLVMTDNKKYYEFGVTSEFKPYFRNRYASFHTILNQNYNIGGTISGYKDEFGMWLSAFAPIRNQEGKTVAVVMVDEKFDDFLMIIKKQMIELFIITFLVFVVMLFGLIWVLRNILARENRDKIAIEYANNENTKIKEELIVVNTKLSKLDKFRKEMISNISHDLRTPIASIVGFLELLKNKKENIAASDKSKFIDIAYTESKRLNNLISNLFELTKLESGQIKLNKEPFNLYELISDILQKYELKIKAKHVKLDFEINEKLGFAFADIKYMDRVFQNLLDNAVRYVDEGGYIKISILDFDDKFKIKICNSGNIISQEELDLIFERYYLSEKSDKTGAGLGLAIAKSICLLHECTIHAESNEFVNSFWFTVPKSV